jgi:hypothetical protein
MNIKNLISIGCSYMTDKYSTPPNSVGSEAANILGLKHVDGWSRWGASNDEIIMKAMAYFLEDRSRIKDTVALIGVTEATRYGSIDNWRIEKDQIGWGPKYFAEQGNERELEMSTSETWSSEHAQWWTFRKRPQGGDLAMRAVRQCLELQNFFKAEGIEYCMFHSIHPMTAWERSKPHKLKYLLQSIDRSRFYKPFEEDFSMTIFADSKNLVYDGHPNHNGNKLWAKIITDFIERNSILKGKI